MAHGTWTEKDRVLYELGEQFREMLRLDSPLNCLMRGKFPPSSELRILTDIASYLRQAFLAYRRIDVPVDYVPSYTYSTDGTEVRTG